MKFVVASVLALVSVASAASVGSSEESPLMATTLDFLARQTGTSEVLTLNLTNLLILLFLKAFIVGFGLFSFGDVFAASARSADESAFSVRQSDLTGGMCFMMFTAGDEAKLSCVQRSACEDPKTATDYLTAAKMWHKLNKLMKVVPFNREYLTIMEAVQEATDHSVAGGNCEVYQW